MASNWWFLYQKDGGEDDWALALAEKRDEITRDIKPRFVTVLDLSGIPDDHDWSKVKYRGPLYFDFDAEGDIELACQQFLAFLAKLDVEYGVDLMQVRLYLSGSKGMHIEVPVECFMPKVPAAGTTWLPYVYRAMAEAMVVDTLDLRVYSGKRGRMWRTTNVQRENGCYKVSISLADALEITPETYADLITAPRAQQPTNPPTCNSKLAMLFDRCRDKVVSHMRGRKKRMEKSNAFLDPWKKIGKTPPTIEKLMSGEIVAPGAGFQSLSMQLAIYATSAGITLEDFLNRCQGLCDTHVSDSSRYGSPKKRREELARMYRYMDENEMYEFDTGPIARLVKPGVSVADLGVMETEDSEDLPTKPTIQESDTEDGEEPTTTVATPAGDDPFKGVRKGFIVNSQGMWRRTGDGYEPVCRATLRKVESFYDVEKLEFKGFEFDLILPGRKPTRAMLNAEAFIAAGTIKRFFAANQCSFQGTDADTMGLLDVMQEKASRGGRTFSYPREGLFIIDNPVDDKAEPAKVYLTQGAYLTSVEEGDPAHFKLRYRPSQALSSYCIDIHNAPHLGDEHKAALHDMFSFSRNDVLADMLGWFVAAHYRSFYLKLYQQFPQLQVYGEAGSGKSQTVWMLAHLHWYKNDISVKSAMSCTPFAMDSHASTSTSAPFILDEYKPRAMRKDRLDKVKDVMKAAYIGGDIGERGTINKGAESNLAVIRNRATAPIVFMGEAIELETAIIERSVSVNLSKTFQTKHRAAAFNRLHDDPVALSALGRDIVELGFKINVPRMKEEFDAILADISANLPDHEDDNVRRPAPRIIYNRALIVHGLRTLQKVLARRFGTTFDAAIEELVNCKRNEQATEQARVIQVMGMSEVSKVMNRMAIMSRDEGSPWELRHNKDYLVGEGWMEMKIERAYDSYRRFCATINDAPLFDSLDAFSFAMNSYAAVTDRQCAVSELRDEGSSERIVRFDIRKLNREGVQSFRN